MTFYWPVKLSTKKNGLPDRNVIFVSVANQIIGIATAEGLKNLGDGCRNGFSIPFFSLLYGQKWGGALCVQTDFTRTFETIAKCNNINLV